MEFSLENFEIYVPEEAEVKTVALKTLPKAILRKMGLNMPVGIHSRDLTSLPEGTCISPVVIRKTGGLSRDDKLNLQVASKQQLRSPNPLTMPFVISNHTAFKVLGDICGKTSNRRAASASPPSPPPPRHSASRRRQDAIIVYRGEVYLSLKKRRGAPPTGSQRRVLPRRDPAADELSPAIEITSDSDRDDADADVPAGAAIEITSSSDDDGQGETKPPVQPRFCETSPEPLKDALQKKAVEEYVLKRRCQVNLIRIPRETLKRLVAKTQMDSVSSRECYGAHEESPENHESEQSPARREVDGPAADLPFNNSDMEQAADAVAAGESDGGEAPPQRKNKKYVLQSETSSSEEGETEEDACRHKTPPLARDTRSESGASDDSEGNAMDGNNNNNNAVDDDGENDAGDCGDVAMEGGNNNNAVYDGENDAGDCGDVAMEGGNSENDAWDELAMDGDNYAGDSANVSLSQSPASFSMDGEHDAVVLGAEEEEGGNASVAEMSAEVPLRCHAFASSTTAAGGQHQNFDFDQLEREEKLARMRAMFKEKDAALSNLL